MERYSKTCYFSRQVSFVSKNPLPLGHGEYVKKKQAYELLKKYNKQEFHLQHARTVSLVMRYFAFDLGYEDEADFWEIVGLLHDIDFEMYPEEHCQKAVEILSENGADNLLIHAVCCHGYGICSDVKPEHTMKKYYLLQMN